MTVELLLLLLLLCGCSSWFFFVLFAPLNNTSYNNMPLLVFVHPTRVHDSFVSVVRQEQIDALFRIPPDVRCGVTDDFI